MSERLDDLDATKDAVREGRLSPEQAGAVADGASANPAAEQDLLDLAERDSLKRARQEAARRRGEARSEEEKAERERRVRKERTARFWYGNGAGHMELRGPIAEVKDLEQRLQRLVDRRFREKRSAKERETRGNYAFDSLLEMSRGSTGPTSTKAPLTRLTLIRVDLSALRRGSVTEGELCEIGGIPVSVGELRRVLGDSVLQLVLTNGDAVIDVVNLNRKPTVAQMLAKLFTDSCCTVEGGCDRAVKLEFDHRDDWARVLTTELHNLDLPCDHHHDLKTYEGWKLVPGTGRRPMVPPDHPDHPDHPDTRPDTVEPGTSGRTLRDTG